MFISIIITVYNAAKYLGKCLDSIAVQDSDDFEVIIVDDGSTDGSAGICDEFCKRENTSANRDLVKVIQIKHSGRGEAANRGLDVATGDWIWFVDSWDLIAPGSVSALKERMRMAKGELYISQSVCVDGNGDDPHYEIMRENQELVRIKNEGDLRWHYTDRILAEKESLTLGIRLFNGDIIRQNGLKFPVSGATGFEDICFLMKYMMFVSREILLINSLYYRRKTDDRPEGHIEQDKAIPRMICLLEEIYKQAERFNKKQIMKEYYMVCLSGLKNLIQNRLDEISDDRICEEVLQGIDNRTIGKHIRKVRKELLSAAYADRIRK